MKYVQKNITEEEVQEQKKNASHLVYTSTVVLVAFQIWRIKWQSPSVFHMITSCVGKKIMLSLFQTLLLFWLRALCYC